MAVTKKKRKKVITASQKAIVLSLLDGANIYDARSSGYRLRTADGCVISKFYSPTFFAIKPLLRKEKNGLYVINKNEVRQLHGKSWIKRQYKKQLNNNA